jgi:hypothetical protein
LIVVVDLNVNLDVNAMVDVTTTQPLKSELDILGMLSFQKLRVYQRSIEFLALTLEILADLPRGIVGMLTKMC